ncbi:hypothetical protein OAF83_01855 [Rubripirellula sp.]|jgi:hypothetical protein|nr:hypothetical protein [Rubripirellula sp.]MBD54677.1 hypothetical protein [Rhodopirellula sp.]MDB4749626.1 hypothetical protein [Rubripirellula sp.]
MDTFVSIVGWGLCLGIGGPLALIGFFHFAFPKAVWSVYRGWGRLWKADPQEIAPGYNSGAAMRVVGIACGLGGLVICVIPKLLGL